MSRKYLSSCINYLIKYRFVISIIIFITVLIFKLHGSSIGMWDSIVTQKINNNSATTILGKPRAIRSDEWDTQVPYYLAQATNNKFYPLINQNIRSDGQNMIIAYNSPVWDITILSKPCNWGFLLMGKDYGFSWYWGSKLIFLFLLSFEMSMILTKGNKQISLLGAIWITLSPAIQWWFMQHVGDLILYSQAIIVSFYYFIKNFNSLKYKIIFGVLFSLSCIGFALVIYPAIQVPMAYTCLLFMILIITDYRKQIKISYKDVLLIIIIFISTVSILAYFIYNCLDAIKILLNTSYPGKRISTGGEIQPYFLQIFLTNIFLPFRDISFLNNCEVSSFFNFLLAIIFSLPFLIINKVKGLKYGLALLFSSVFEACWMLFSFPEAFSKITLLSYVTGQRMMITFGITTVYLSIWAFAVFSDLKPINKISSIIISFLVSIIYFLSIIESPMRTYLKFKYYILVLLLFFILNYLFLRGIKKSFIVIMLAVIFISGATVNPIAQGIGSIYNKVLSKQIIDIKQNDPSSNWVVLDNTYLSGYLISNGVKCLNADNFYPDLNLWSKLDVNKKYFNIYNRYAHINLVLTTNNTTFKLLHPDSIQINLNLSDISKMNIKYILTKTNLTTAFKNNNIYFNNIYPKDKDGFYIYKVEIKP